MTILPIVLREFRENRLLPPFGLVLGLFAFLLPRVVRFPAAYPATGFWEVPLLGALFLGFVLAVVLGFLLGAGLLGPDLQEGRAGFYLARPLAPAHLLLGKLVAAFILAAAVGLLAVLPTYLSHPVPVVGRAPLVLALVLLGAILLGHALSIAFRDRGAWMLVDGLLVLGGLGGAWLGIQRLVSLSALEDLGAFGLLLGSGLLAALLAGAFAQAHWGRSDLRRGHRALTLATGALLLATGLGARAWFHRLEHPAPASLGAVHLERAGRAAPWVLLSCVPDEDLFPMASPKVLLEVERGRTLRVGTAPVVLSPSGRRAAGLEFTGWPALGRITVWVADLGPGGARVRHTLLQPAPFERETLLVLDEDGHRLACLGAKALEVYDLDAERRLFREDLQTPSPAWVRSATFLGPDHLRIYLSHPAGDPVAFDLHDLDLRRGTWAPTGRVLAEAPAGTAAVLRERPAGRNAAGDLLLACGAPEGSRSATWTLRDGRTGDLRRLLTASAEPGQSTWAFLPDGGLLGVECTPAGTWVRSLDPEGAERWRAPLEGAPVPTRAAPVQPFLGPQAFPGRLTVQLRAKGAPVSQVQAYTVDLAGKRALRREGGAGPERLGFPWRAELLGPAPTGTWAARVWGGLGGGLWLLAPEGGSRNLLPGREP